MANHGLFSGTSDKPVAASSPAISGRYCISFFSRQTIKFFHSRSSGAPSGRRRRRASVLSAAVSSGACSSREIFEHRSSQIGRPEQNLLFPAILPLPPLSQVQRPSSIVLPVRAPETSFRRVRVSSLFSRNRSGQPPQATSSFQQRDAGASAPLGERPFSVLSLIADAETFRHTIILAARRRRLARPLSAWTRAVHLPTARVFRSGNNLTFSQGEFAFLAITDTLKAMSGPLSGNFDSPSDSLPGQNMVPFFRDAFKRVQAPATVLKEAAIFW